MLWLRFTARHFLRHGRMNLLLLGSLLLTTTLLASLPMYADAIAGRSLRQRLVDMPAAARNIEVVGPGEALTSALYASIRESLAELVAGRVEVRDLSSLNARSLVFEATGVERVVHERLFLRFWSFDNLSAKVTVVEGRLPQFQAAVPGETQAFVTVEAAVGAEAAEAMALSLGDEVRAADETVRVVIVGILAPSDPAADMWWGDLLPFGVQRVIACPSCPDDLFLSVLVAPQTMASTLPEHTRSWRLLTNVSTVTVENAVVVQSRIDALEARLGAAQLRTGLTQEIDGYLGELALARVTVFLLTVQSLIFALYTVGLLSAFLVERSRSELVVMSGRGFTGWQMTGIYALEGLALALLIAAPLGPPLAWLALSVWAPATGNMLPPRIPTDSWRLALLAAAFAWLALVVPVFLATRGDLLAWQRPMARPSGRTIWQRLGLDLFFMVLGGLVYWQLRDTGSFVTFRPSAVDSSASGVADPLLLLGPSLLLLAVALLFLRLFPYLLRLAAWWGQRSPGLVLPFGLARLSRDPAGPSQVVLLVSLAAGLTFFATAFGHSLKTRQAEMAHYLTGADLRLAVAFDAGPADSQRIAGLDGMQAVSPAYYNNRVRFADQLGRQATLLAIDPASFDRVAHYAPGISSLTLASILPALEQRSAEGLPAVFSAESHPPEKQVGDIVHYMIGSQRVAFEVRGIIRNFPHVDGAFFIANLADVEQLGPLPADGRKELWLAVQPERHGAVSGQIAADGLGLVVGDSQARLRSLQADLPAAETLGALDLNAVALTLLSVAVFVLVHYFAARQRLYEFSLLRAVGLSTEQLLRLLSLEGAIMMVLGLAGGTAIGYGLARLMRPFFSEALANAVAGGAINRIQVDWLEVGGLYVLLAAAYGMVMAISLGLLIRAGVHRALRLGEE